MMRPNYTTFWQGWEGALEAIEARVLLLQKEVDTHTKPHDLIFDVLNEIKEVKAVATAPGLTDMS